VARREAWSACGFAASLALAFGASMVFARRLDRLGRRLGWPEAMVGLLTATAADGPELASAIVAITQGSGAVGVGVVVGSNLFNLAAMVGAVELVARTPIRVGRSELVQEVSIALAITGAAPLVLAGALPRGSAWRPAASRRSSTSSRWSCRGARQCPSDSGPRRSGSQPSSCPRSRSSPSGASAWCRPHSRSPTAGTCRTSWSGW